MRVGVTLDGMQSCKMSNILLGANTETKIKITFREAIADRNSCIFLLDKDPIGVESTRNAINAKVRKAFECSGDKNLESGIFYTILTN